MTDLNIQQQADDVRETIEASRSIIAGGQFVDIAEVEQKMTRLFDTVSENPKAGLKVDVGNLAGSLASLLSELEALEIDLAHQHEGLITENTVAPNSAAAAYQS